MLRDSWHVLYSSDSYAVCNKVLRSPRWSQQREACHFFATKLDWARDAMKLLLGVCVLLSCFSVQIVSSKTRKYYIAAVEKEWDYAPSGYNKVKGIKLEEDR